MCVFSTQDYCSLPQRRGSLDDRTPELKERFRFGLRTINRWYVHRLTTVILVTKLPNDLTKYSNNTDYDGRGWTTTERSLASIVKSSLCLIDTAKMDCLEGEELTGSEALEHMVASRRAPPVPEAFAAMLESGVKSGGIKFTAAADLRIVIEQYSRGFTESFETTEGLYYARLGWDDNEVLKLCDALRHSKPQRLKRLRLQGNNLTDKSVQQLATSLARQDLMPRLELLNVEQNMLSLQGTDLLDMVCAAKSVQLRADDQDPDAAQKGVPSLTQAASGSEIMIEASTRFPQQDDNKFVVFAGPHAGAYDAVYISTDLEPDDVVAIKALAPRLRRKPLFCVVGESTTDKRNIMKDVLRHCGLHGRDSQVVNGRESRKKYPSFAVTVFQANSTAASTDRRLSSDQTEHTLDYDSLRAECKQKLEAFLQKHSAPLAILLKPPHELRDLSASALQKTVAVAYGSFNLTEMREAMANEEGLSEQDAFAEQWATFSKLKSCVMIERASSVGRVESISKDHKLWKYVESDIKLIKLIRRWQDVTLDRITRTSLPKLVEQMEKCVQQHEELAKAGRRSLSTVQEEGPASNSSQKLAKTSYQRAVISAASDKLAYASLAELTTKVEKKMGVLKDICMHESLQLPLADPLVAAALLDHSGMLNSFWKQCKTNIDMVGKVTVQPDEGSSIHWLWSGGEQSRKELVSKVHRILEDALQR